MFESTKLLHVFVATEKTILPLQIHSRVTFLYSTELRNEAAQLSQDHTVPSFTVEEIISNFTFSLSQLTTNLFDIEK